MTQNFNQPQGSNPPQNDKPPVKKFTPALLFSAFFVAVSFIVMLIPLALFNISQVAAVLGKKAAFVLMLCIAALFVVLGGLFGNSPLLFTGFLVLATIPIFMLAISIREKKRPWFYAAAILFTPVLLLLGVLITIPTYSHLQFEQRITEVKQEVTAKAAAAIKENPAAEKAAQDSSQALLKQVDELAAVPFVREFFGYSAWQRLGYMVFGMGASLFLIVLLISIANVVFVDFGFEQIERLRAIVNYVKRNPAAFPAQLSTALFALPMVRSNRLQTPLFINHHGNQSVEMSSSESEGGWRFVLAFWKPIKPKNMMYWQGYSFQFEGKCPWSLREFSLPFPLACLSIAVLGAMGFWYGNLETILTSMEHNVFAPFIAILSVLSFIAITIIALQGMFTIYKRVPSLFLLIIMAFLLFIGSRLDFVIGPYAVLAVFGTVGLLDYVYDWRGIKA
ncbi:hypothetical protein [Silvanigrella aquatica]|uniref:Uncharacterized protein n=1 Tax=Silvanigrella aquatica TaxID=1915309 RepID=A0A1L4D264_9BACT|nr:hypothetical protein [Silvanigrella aquatica]APJ04281.1 hypothetical protein AXG55_10335 [Silvanigrella aquatica]